MTTIEALAIITRRLRAALSSEAVGEFGTQEVDELMRAIRVVTAATSHDMHTLGVATMQLLLESLQAHVMAEQAALVARIAALRGEADPA